MARGAFRVGDSDSRGDIMVTGSPNVYVNGRRLTRVGDIDNDIPPDRMVTGSPTVITNGRMTSRRGDIDNDNEVTSSFSGDTFIGPN